MKNEQFVKHFLIVNEGLRARCQSRRANGEGGIARAADGRAVALG